MAYQAVIIFCRLDRKIALSFKGLLERFLNINIHMFEGDTSGGEYGADLEFNTNTLEHFMSEGYKIFVYATSGFVSSPECRNICLRLQELQIHKNITGNVIPVITSFIKLPWGIRSLRPLKLNRLVRHAQVDMYDSITDEITLNEIDDEILLSLRKAFPPKNNE